MLKPNPGLDGFTITLNNNKPLSYFNSEANQAQTFANPKKKQRREINNVDKYRQILKQRQGLSSDYLLDLSKITVFRRQFSDIEHGSQKVK